MEEDMNAGGRSSFLSGQKNLNMRERSVGSATVNRAGEKSVRSNFGLYEGGIFGGGAGAGFSS
jgi:hypothetical protein